MRYPSILLVVLVSNVLTPIVGVICGFVAQARYKKRLRSLPAKVVSNMPKRFPMADMLLCLFMLGPILGIVSIVTMEPLPTLDPSTANLFLRWTTLAVLMPINLSGPYLIKLGMPPDGTFKFDGNLQTVEIVGKPVVKQSLLFDAREL